MQTTEIAIQIAKTGKAAANASAEPVYKVEVPANRYEIFFSSLCF